MVRRRAAGVALLGVVLVGCTDDAERGPAGETVTSETATSASLQPGWQRVAFEGVTFDVPAEWTVETPEDWSDFACGTYEDNGVFLAPPPPEEGGLCRGMLPGEYGTNVHVLRYGGEALEAGDGATMEGAGDGRRWVRSTTAERWHSATFVERGVRMEFYGIDDATYETIVASVEGKRA